MVLRFFSSLNCGFGLLNSLGTISKFPGTIFEFLRTFLTDFPGLFLILKGIYRDFENSQRRRLAHSTKNPAEDFDPGIYASQKTSLSGRRQKHAEPTGAKLIVDPL